MANVNWSIDSVRLGEYDTTKTIDCIENADNTTDCIPIAKSIKIENHISHEKYVYGKTSYNLAILKLNQNVVFNDYVQSICLPDHKNQTSMLKQKFQVAGWGIISNRPTNPIKLRSYVSLIDKKWCSDIYDKRGVVLAEDQMCLGKNNKKNEHVCFADSGGPLMGFKSNRQGEHRMTVYGVFTHYSIFCDYNGWPGIFTDVTPYGDWILERIKN